jgi:hypothetical protein
METEKRKPEECGAAVKLQQQENRNVRYLTMLYQLLNIPISLLSFHSFATQNVAERIVKMIFNDKNLKI